MVTLQEYLNSKYPAQSEKEQVTEIGWGSLPIAEAKQLDGSKLDLSSYPNLKKVYISGLKTKLTSLNLSNCTQLIHLNVINNHLRTLDLSHCQQLEILCCANNYLTQIVYPTNLSVITNLDVSSNNLPTSDCSVFSRMVNLEYLLIGNTDQAKIDQGIYNRWSGSLAPLQSCIKLESLVISNTDLDSGLEYLPASVKTFYCSADKRKDAKCQFLYNCFANEQGQVETEWKNGPIVKFHQKLQNYKQKIRLLLQAELQAKNQLIQKVETEILNLKKELSDRDEEIEKINLEKQQVIAQLKNEKTQLELESKHLKENLAQQEIEFKDQNQVLQNKIASQTQTIQTLWEQNTNNNSLVEQLTKEKQELERQLAQKQNEQEKWESKENNHFPNELITTIAKIYQELNNTNPNLEKIKKELLEIQIKDKKGELNSQKTELEQELDANGQEWLETLLETHEEVNKNPHNTFAHKQLDKFKEKLSHQIERTKIENICRLQSELKQLEISHANLSEEKMLFRMEVNY